MCVKISEQSRSSVSLHTDLNRNLSDPVETGCCACVFYVLTYVLLSTVNGVICFLPGE